MVRSIFPVPMPPPPEGALSSSRKSCRRATRRRCVWEQSCRSIDALNALAGHGDKPVPVDCSPAHQSVQKNVSSVISLVLPNSVPDARESFNRVLSKVRTEYDGLGTTVRPYDRDRISKPPVGFEPVILDSMFAHPIDEVLSPNILLCDGEEVTRRKSESSVKRPYCDKILSNNMDKRLEFYGDMIDSGLLGACKSRIAEIQPFPSKK